MILFFQPTAPSETHPPPAVLSPENSIPSEISIRKPFSCQNLPAALRSFLHPQTGTYRTGLCCHNRIPPASGRIRFSGVCLPSCCYNPESSPAVSSCLPFAAPKILTRNGLTKMTTESQHLSCGGLVPKCILFEICLKNRSKPLKMPEFLS